LHTIYSIWFYLIFSNIGVTTLKNFALHYNNGFTSCLNLQSHPKLSMLTPYHIILFAILLVVSSASIFQMSTAEQS